MTKKGENYQQNIFFGKFLGFLNFFGQQCFTSLSNSINRDETAAKALPVFFFKDFLLFLVFFKYGWYDEVYDTLNETLSQRLPEVVATNSS